MLTGTDTGFAVTPYGEWNARELELFVDDLGFTPAAALRAATEVNARFMTEGDRIGALEPGRAADFIALDASPLADIRRVAGQEPAARRLYRRQGDPHPRPPLRPAPGHRLRADQLDRALHPGAGRRIAAQQAPHLAAAE